MNEKQCDIIKANWGDALTQLLEQNKFPLCILPLKIEVCHYSGLSVEAAIELLFFPTCF